MAKTITGASMNTNNLSAPTTLYLGLCGRAVSSSSSYLSLAVPIGVDGKASGMGISISTNPCSFSVVVTSYKNGSNGNQSFSVPAGNTGFFSDTTGEDTVSAGDLFCAIVTFNPSDSGSLTTLAQKFEFDTNDSTNNTITHLFNRLLTTTMISSATTYYIPLHGWSTPDFTSETYARLEQKYSGTYLNLSAYISTNSRANSCTLSSRKNTADGNLSVSIPGGQTGIFEEASPSSDSVAADDMYNLKFVTGSGTEALTFAYTSINFKQTSDPGSGIVILCNAGGSSPVRMGENQTRYLPLSGSVGNFGVWDTLTEAEIDVNDDFTFKGLTIDVQFNDINAANTLTFMKNQTATSMTISVPNSTTGIFEDLTHTVDTVAGDSVCYKAVSGSSSGTRFFCPYFIYVYTEIAGVSTGQEKVISHSIGIALSSITRTRNLKAYNSSNVTITPSYSRKRGLKAYNSSNISISPTHSRLRGLKGSHTSNVTIASDLSKIRNLLRSHTSNVAISATPSKSTTRQRSFTENIEISLTSINKLRGLLKTFSESISTISLSSINKLRGLNRSNSHNISIDSSVNFQRSLLKTISESINVVLSSINRTREINRIISIDPITVTLSSINKFFSKFRSFSENIEISSIDINRSRNKLKELSESITLSLSSINKIRAKLKTTDHNIEISLSSINRLQTKLRTFSESITISLTDIVQSFAMIKTISHNIEVVLSSINKQRSLLKSVNHNISLNINVEKFRLLLRDFTETFSISATIEKTLAISKTFSENINIVLSSIERTQTKLRTISQLVATINSSHIKMSSKLRILSQLVSTINSSHIKTTSRFRTLSENIGISLTSIDRLRSLLQTVLPIADIGISITSINKQRSKLKMFSQDILLSLSTIFRSTGRKRTISHNITITSDHVKSKIRDTRIIAHNIGIAVTDVTQSFLKTFYIKLLRIKGN